MHAEMGKRHVVSRLVVPIPPPLLSCSYQTELKEETLREILSEKFTNAVLSYIYWPHPMFSQHLKFGNI